MSEKSDEGLRSSSETLPRRYAEPVPCISASVSGCTSDSSSSEKEEIGRLKSMPSWSAWRPALVANSAVAQMDERDGSRNVCRGSSVQASEANRKTEEEEEENGLAFAEEALAGLKGEARRSRAMVNAAPSADGPVSLTYDYKRSNPEFTEQASLPEGRRAMRDRGDSNFTAAVSTRGLDEESRTAFVSGALAGAATAMLLQPLDVLKTAQQQPRVLSQATDGYSSPSAASQCLNGRSVSRIPPTSVDSKSFRISSTILRLYSSDGALAFWRGSAPTLLRIVPGAGLYFMSLNQLHVAYPRVQRLLSDFVLRTPSSKAAPPNDGGSNAASSPACPSTACDLTTHPAFAPPLPSSTTPSAHANTGVCILSDTRPPSALYNLVSSGIARGVVALLMSPFSVLKTRLEATSSKAAPSSLPSAPSSSSSRRVLNGRLIHAVNQTLHTEGFRGFYRGLSATLVRDVPYTSLYFGLYTHLQHLYSLYVQHSYLAEYVLPASFAVESQSFIDARPGKPRGNPGEDTRWKWSSSAVGRNLCCSAAAGLLASLVTHPADVVRTRLQLYHLPSHSPLKSPAQRYSSTIKGSERYDARKVPDNNYGGKNAILGRRFLHTSQVAAAWPPTLKRACILSRISSIGRRSQRAACRIDTTRTVVTRERGKRCSGKFKRSNSCWSCTSSTAVATRRPTASVSFSGEASLPLSRSSSRYYCLRGFRPSTPFVQAVCPASRRQPLVTSSSASAVRSPASPRPGEPAACAAKSSKCPSMRQLCISMVREEGVSSLFRGVAPRLAKRTLMTALTWTAFEELFKIGR